MVGKQRRHAFCKPVKPSMRSWSSKKLKNYYGETRTRLAPLYDEHLPTSRIVYVAFDRRKPQVTCNELHHFFLREFGDVVDHIQMDPLFPPYHAWVFLHGEDMVDQVLQGDLPMKFYNEQGKSIWLKRSAF